MQELTRALGEGHSLEHLVNTKQWRFVIIYETCHMSPTLFAVIAYLKRTILNRTSQTPSAIFQTLFLEHKFFHVEITAITVQVLSNSSQSGQDSYSAKRKKGN